MQNFKARGACVVAHGANGRGVVAHSHVPADQADAEARRQQNRHAYAVAVSIQTGDHGCLARGRRLAQ